MEKIELRNVVCRHNVSVVTGYHGTVVHLIVFYDPKDHETYFWKCTSGGLDWEEGATYSITAQKEEGTPRISRVRILSDHVESEQKKITVAHTVNALDILMPDTNLTNDEKYDIITNRKER